MGTIIDLNAEENKITQKLLDCFLRVHKTLGPGLLESIYEECVCHVLEKEGIAFQRQKIIPLPFEGIILQSGLRLDLLVEDTIIVELKSVEKLLPIHEAQILSYLRLAEKPIGFLVNFNEPLIKHGTKRFVNNFKNSANSAPPR